MEQSRSTKSDRRCRLCDATTQPWITVADGREYQRCSTCGIIQLASHHLPDRDSERARYELHDDGPENAAYRRYLGGIADTLVRPHVNPGGRVLDFGAGPHAVLTDILTTDGYQGIAYDPFFVPNHEALRPAGPDAGYDAIILVEVFEHLHEPGRELTRLCALLRPGGHLLLRTGIAPTGANGEPDPQAFLAWWYRQDLTHVTFLTAAAVTWIADTHGLACRAFHGTTNVVFRAPDG